MIDNLQIYLTVENIYLAANWGVIPFWLLLIFMPNSTLTNFFVNSIIIPTLMSAAYLFLVYKIFQDGNFLEGFSLYGGIDEIYAVFSDENFLLIFWLHFLTLSLFVGAWITRDSMRYSIPKIILIISLIITYFTGPIGIVTYWFFRIFFAKKINLNE